MYPTHPALDMRTHVVLDENCGREIPVTSDPDLRTAIGEKFTELRSLPHVTKVFSLHQLGLKGETDKDILLKLHWQVKRWREEANDPNLVVVFVTRDKRFRESSGYKFDGLVYVWVLHTAVTGHVHIGSMPKLALLEFIVIYFPTTLQLVIHD